MSTKYYKMKTNNQKRITNNRIQELNPGEIFVFGSNLEGAHGGGAALLAFRKWGAIWGQGTGLQGQTYGIPTIHGGVEEIRPYVDEFIRKGSGRFCWRCNYSTIHFSIFRLFALKFTPILNSLRLSVSNGCV